jgi:GNAT superfamily N-acetyltransferase
VGIQLGSPAVDELGDVLRVLREWQHTDAPMQLHPGDLGWHWQFGAEATAAAVRTWSLAGQIVAIGMLDSPKLLRLTTAPHLRGDERLAEQVVADVTEPERGVLPAGEAAVEAPNGARVPELLSQVGWNTDDPWTPLGRDLTEPVDHPDLRIEVVGPERAPACTAVHQSAFGSPRFTVERWHAMAAGLPFADARCLLGYDNRGNAVAEVTVWSAGPGRPGLLEPMGVHADQRGRGHGRAICVAAAAALQALGSSSAIVCTSSANAGGVAAYRSAGFTPHPQRCDRSRPA